MTREETRKLLPIMKAYSEGEEIEHSYDGKCWLKVVYPTWHPDLLYRIKPGSKYRPFESQEECWQEMQKHQPFGWVRSKLSKILYQIDTIDDTVYFNRGFSSYPVIFDNCNFVDGTPFGIKED